MNREMDVLSSDILFKKWLSNPRIYWNKALDAFTEALAVELREHKIQVNCIAPVFVATDAVRRCYASEIQSEQALEPLDVAQLALFLLSSRADHISGQVIAVRSKDDHG